MGTRMLSGRWKSRNGAGDKNGKMEEGLEVREGRGRDPVIKRDMESE